MKKNRVVKILYLVIALLGFQVFSCSDSFLDVPAQSSLSTSLLANKKGIEQSLISVYSSLKGSGLSDNWQGSNTGWVFGGVVGQEAFKGSNSGDQSEINPLSSFSVTSTNDYIASKWRACYEGIGRANNVLKLIQKAPANELSADDIKRITGEARFLRGFYHLELKKHFGKIPFIDETIDYTLGNYRVPNDVDSWPKIVEDFQFAYDNLAGSGMDKGRANKWAARAFLGKCYLYQKNYASAKAAFDDVIANGVTAGGTRYALNAKFRDAFDAPNDNSAESVFAIQASVNDGSGASNANADQVLNFPYLSGAPVNCCGFYQPSLDQANSYRTDANGFPLLDGTYNSPANVLEDEKWFGTTTPTRDMGNLDPRIDWIVARTGVPFFDWGIYTGPSWVRLLSDGGPYSVKKMVFPKSQIGTYTDGSSWTAGYSAVNYNLMRYADVLLMAAEAEVELNNLNNAKNLVNQVRQRAANTAGFLKIVTGTSPTAEDHWKAYLGTYTGTSTNAGTYNIALYGTGTDNTFGTQTAARKAVHFERKLELGMEGHRFFDLVRWGEITTTNTNGNPVNLESAYRYNASLVAKTIYGTGFPFKVGQHEVFPIPQSQIDLSNGTLKQNSGY